MAESNQKKYLIQYSVSRTRISITTPLIEEKDYAILSKELIELHRTVGFGDCLDLYIHADCSSKTIEMIMAAVCWNDPVSMIVNIPRAIAMRGLFVSIANSRCWPQVRFLSIAYVDDICLYVVMKRMNKLEMLTIHTWSISQALFEELLQCLYTQNRMIRVRFPNDERRMCQISSNERCVVTNLTNNEFLFTPAHAFDALAAPESLK